MPPVKFYLRFSRPAEKAAAAPLALQVCPAPHQPAALVSQMRQFHL